MITIFMETKNEDTCLKIRSTRATVAAGLRLYMGNFRRIFRATWLPALLLALASALSYQMMISTTSRLQNSMAQMAQGHMDGDWMSQYLMQSGVSLLSFLVMLLFVSYAFSMLSRHRQEGFIPVPARWLTKPDGRSLARTVAIAMVWFVVGLIVTVICSIVLALGVVRHSVAIMGISLLLAIVLLALLLPLTYPSMRYVTTRDTRLFDILGSGYRQGLRYWGYIFAVLFVIILIAAVILSVTMLPAIVLLTANIKAQAGAAMGDALGMPSYMSWMSFLVFTLSGFIQAYVALAIIFPAYYMAGSIEQQEIQRNETTKNTIH